MPRDGSNLYSKPAGTTAITATVIDSTKYNSTIDDIVADLNLVRPIIAGGTGASTLAGLLAAIGGQPSNANLNSIAGQVLTAFALTLLDDANAAAALTTLGIGGDIPALEALAGTGITVRTATNTYAQRTVTAGTGVTVTNGDGVLGNPTISVALNLNLNLGIGQTWQNLTASRAITTVYQNLTTKPIFVNIYSITNASFTSYAEVSADNITFVRVGRTLPAPGSNVSFIVPVSHYYRLTQTTGFASATTFENWSELR